MDFAAAMGYYRRVMVCDHRGARGLVGAATCGPKRPLRARSWTSVGDTRRFSMRPDVLVQGRIRLPSTNRPNPICVYLSCLKSRPNPSSVSPVPPCRAPLGGPMFQVPHRAGQPQEQNTSDSVRRIRSDLPKAAFHLRRKVATLHAPLANVARQAPRPGRHRNGR